MEILILILVYFTPNIKLNHNILDCLNYSSQLEITIFNMVNGVRTNINDYLCSVKEDTLTPSETDVLVVTTWQIKAKRWNHVVCNAWTWNRTRMIKQWHSTQLSAKYTVPGGPQESPNFHRETLRITWFLAFFFFALPGEWRHSAPRYPAWHPGIWQSTIDRSGFIAWYVISFIWTISPVCA